MEDRTQLLHKALTDKGLYTKSYEDFTTQFSDPAKRDLLYKALQDKGMYTKTREDFDTQFFPVDTDTKKKSPLLNIGQDTGVVSKESSEPIGMDQSPSILPTPDLTLKTPDALGFQEETPETRVAKGLEGTLERAKPPRETTPMGDMLRTLKSESYKTFGAVGATPSMFNRTVQAVTLKPLMKLMGASDEEAELFIDHTNSLNTFGQGFQQSEEVQKMLNEKAKKVEEKIFPIEGGIWDNLTEGKDGKKDTGAAFEQFGRGLFGSVPYLALAASTSGLGNAAVLGTIGAVSATQQYHENEGMKSDNARLLNSWLYGGFEAVGELASAYIFRGIGKSFRQGLAKELAPSGAKDIAKGIATSVGLEGSSEAITQIGQNITDIVTGKDPDKNIFDGALDAATVGGLGFGLFGGVTNPAAAMVGRAIASDKEVTQVNDNAKQQQVLIEQAEQTDSDPVKRALLKSVKDLKVEADGVMDENYKLAQMLSPKQKEQVAELYSVWNELQAEIDGGKIAPDRVKTIETTIQGVKDQIQGIKEELVTKIEEQEAQDEKAKANKGKAKDGEAAVEPVPLAIGKDEFKTKKELTEYLEEKALKEDGTIDPDFFDYKENNWPDPKTIKVINEWVEGKMKKPQSNYITETPEQKEARLKGEPRVETSPSGQTKPQSVYNKQEVIESAVSDLAEENKDMMRSELASMPRDEFDKYATQAGFSNVGSHWVRGDVMKEPTSDGLNDGVSEGVSDGVSSKIAHTETAQSKDSTKPLVTDKKVEDLTMEDIVVFHGTSTESAMKVKEGKFDGLKRDEIWVSETREIAEDYGDNVFEWIIPKGAKVFNGDQINVKYLRDNRFPTEKEAYAYLKEQGYDIISFRLGKNKIILNTNILKTPQESVQKPTEFTEFEQEGNIEQTAPKEAITAPITQKQSEVPPIAQEPPKVDENVSKDQKPLGAQENSLIQYETDQQQIVTDIIDQNKGFYDVLHFDVATENARNFIKEKTIEGATTDLMNPSKSTKEMPTRQVARMMLLDYYSRILGDTNSSKAVKDKAYDYVNKLQERISRESNESGQANAMLNIWKVMQPSGLLEFTKRKITEYNEKRLNKKVKGTDKTAGQLIDLLYTTLSEDNKKVIDDILEGKEITSALPRTENTKREAPPKRTVAKEKVKQEQDYRKNLLTEYKKKNKGITLLAGAPLTTEQMELGGNLIASYVREGYYRLADVIEKLKKDLDSVGIVSDDKGIDDILNRTKDNKGTYRDFILQETEKTGLKEGLKDLKLRIKDVVKKHYTERDELGRTLAEKLVDDAYLTKEEADKLSKAIFEQYQKAIKERIESNKDLAEMIGRERVPSDKKKRTIMDRILETTNLGVTESDFYMDLFSEKFGLKPNLSTEVGAEIMRLASVVQQVTNKGFFYRDAVIDLAKYIYELQPKSVMREIGDTWIALNYAHMLSGIPTSLLNLISSGSNILFKPLRDVTNFSRHLQALKRTKVDGVWGTAESFTANTHLPFASLYNIPLADGVAKGAVDAAEVYVNGDIGSKYVEEISKNGQFKVSELERNKYGKDRAFKPITIKVGNKSYTLRNPLDFEKFVARNLAAQDRLMFNTSFELEIADIIRDNLALQGLKGDALVKKTMEIYRGRNINQAAIDKQLFEETANYQQLTGKTLSPRQMKIRKRELMLESLIEQGALTEEQKSEAEAIARGNVFTDDRGGTIATVANYIGQLANHSALAGTVVKPYVPFTKIVGNVTEFMLDHTPVYGLMRANGWGVSAIVKHKLGASPTGLTSQMGEKGSRLYYEQMGRAWFGLTVFTSLLAMGLGNDEEDWFEITGGYNEEKKKNQLGRENVTPKYSIRFGDTVISYLNIPSLAVPLALIGNLNDNIRAGMPEDEIRDRFTLALLGKSVVETITMTRDMSFVQGGMDLANTAVDLTAMDESTFKKTGQSLLKRYTGYALRPLPQNTAVVQQTWKFFDPTSYSQKDVKSILAYSAGLQHFVGIPSIDQLGDDVFTYPGEGLIPYTHWMKIRGEDERWKFLADNDAIPVRIKNQDTAIDTEDGVDTRKMEPNEFHDYTVTSGKMFSEMLSKYMSDKNNVEKRGKERIVEINKGEETVLTGIQQDVAKMVYKSRDDARTQLFRWYDFKKTNPTDWKLMVDQGAVKQPVGGNIEIEVGKSTVVLTGDQMEEYNQHIMERYHKYVMKYLKGDKPDRDKKRWADREKTRTVFDERISDDWSDAKRAAEDIMYKELKSTLAK